MANNQQHIFFQQFFNNQQQNTSQSPSNSKIDHNCLMLEMANNWPFVRCMMFKHREGRLKQVDEWEHSWINYIMSNNIDIESFKDKDDFLEKNLLNLQD